MNDLYIFVFFLQNVYLPHFSKFIKSRNVILCAIVNTPYEHIVCVCVYCVSVATYIIAHHTFTHRLRSRLQSDPFISYSLSVCVSLCFSRGGFISRCGKRVCLYACLVRVCVCDSSVLNNFHHLLADFSINVFESTAKLCVFFFFIVALPRFFLSFSLSLLSFLFPFSVCSLRSRNICYRCLALLSPICTCVFVIVSCGSQYMLNT